MKPNTEVIINLVLHDQVLGWNYTPAFRLWYASRRDCVSHQDITSEVWGQIKAMMAAVEHRFDKTHPGETRR
jgi:hypothetical protein